MCGCARALALCVLLLESGRVTGARRARKGICGDGTYWSTAEKKCLGLDGRVCGQGTKYSRDTGKCEPFANAYVELDPNGIPGSGIFQGENDDGSGFTDDNGEIIQATRKKDARPTEAAILDYVWNMTNKTDAKSAVADVMSKTREDGSKEDDGAGRALVVGLFTGSHGVHNSSYRSPAIEAFADAAFMHRTSVGGGGGGSGGDGGGRTRFAFTTDITMAQHASYFFYKTHTEERQGLWSTDKNPKLLEQFGDEWRYGEKFSRWHSRPRGIDGDHACEVPPTGGGGDGLAGSGGAFEFPTLLAESRANGV